MGHKSAAAGNSGVKVSYILSASKNIKVNENRNISIKDLIANKDKNVQDMTAPYF